MVSPDSGNLFEDMLGEIESFIDTVVKARQDREIRVWKLQWTQLKRI